MKNNWKNLVVRTVLSAVLVLPLYDFFYIGLPWLYDAATLPRGFAVRGFFATLSVGISFSYLIEVAVVSMSIQSPTNTIAQTFAEIVLGFVIWLPIIVCIIVGIVLFGINILFGHPSQFDGEIVSWLGNVCPWFLVISYGIASYITHRIPIEQKLYYRPPVTRKMIDDALLRYKKEKGYT